jgi:acetylornithine deacetylase/succinyl-diaminopimelate desuccinylase-like protein
MYGILREKNVGLSGAVVDFAGELIRLPSPTLQEEQAARLVELTMVQAGYDRVVRDPSGNVVGVMLGREGTPSLLLMSHMDTVATSPDAKWSDSPTSGLVRDGRLFGLGAADCKAGLAAQIFAGCLLKRSLFPLRGNLIVAATVAEANGCSVGARRLVEKTLKEMELRPDYAILGEPTGLGLYYGHDGWVELDVRMEGANPFQVGDAAKAVYDDIARGAQDAGSQVEEMSLRRPRFENVRGMRRATMQLSRRLSASEQTHEVIRQVEHEAQLVARSMGAVAVEVAVRQEQQQLYTGQTTVVRRVTHAWATDPFNPLMERSRQALAAAGCRVRPGKWELGRLGMGTAGSMLVNEFHIPTIGYGPGEEVQAHAANESVAVSQVVEAVYGTAAIAHSLVGIPVFGWSSDEI